MSSLLLDHNVSFPAGNNSPLPAPSDVGRVLSAVFGLEVPGPVVLVGHSMGGAIAVHAEHLGLIGEVIISAAC